MNNNGHEKHRVRGWKLRRALLSHRHFALIEVMCINEYKIGPWSCGLFLTTSETDGRRERARESERNKGRVCMTRGQRTKKKKITTYNLEVTRNLLVVSGYSKHRHAVACMKLTIRTVSLLSSIPMSC